MPKPDPTPVEAIIEIITAFAPEATNEIKKYPIMNVPADGG
jgi:hypothetical protein